MWKQILIVAFVFFGCIACQEGPEAISFGKDQCSYCKMSISDPKFGAELITDKGRIQKYDALECMVNDLKANDPKYSALYAIAYDDPKALVHVDSLLFVTSPEYRSPMGAHLAAFKKVNSVDAGSAEKWDEFFKDFEH